MANLFIEVVQILAGARRNFKPPAIGNMIVLFDADGGCGAGLGRSYQNDVSLVRLALVRSELDSTFREVRFPFNVRC